MEKTEEKHLPTYVLRSKYRKDVFFEIIKKPYLTQTDLLKITPPNYRSHMARTIKELERYGLIECENPNEKRYKMYFATKKGLVIKEEIKKYGKE